MDEFFNHKSQTKYRKKYNQWEEFENKTSIFNFSVLLSNHQATTTTAAPPSLLPPSSVRSHRRPTAPVPSPLSRFPLAQSPSSNFATDTTTPHPTCSPPLLSFTAVNCYRRRPSFVGSAIPVPLLLPLRECV